MAYFIPGYWCEHNYYLEHSLGLYGFYVKKQKHEMADFHFLYGRLSNNKKQCTWLLASVLILITNNNKMVQMCGSFLEHHSLCAHPSPHMFNSFYSSLLFFGNQYSLHHLNNSNNNVLPTQENIPFPMCRRKSTRGHMAFV